MLGLTGGRPPAKLGSCWGEVQPAGLSGLQMALGLVPPCPRLLRFRCFEWRSCALLPAYLCACWPAPALVIWKCREATETPCWGRAACLPM